MTLRCHAGGELPSISADVAFFAWPAAVEVVHRPPTSIGRRSTMKVRSRILTSRPVVYGDAEVGSDAESGKPLSPLVVRLLKTVIRLRRYTIADSLGLVCRRSQQQGQRSGIP